MSIIVKPKKKDPSRGYGKDIKIKKYANGSENKKTSNKYRRLEWRKRYDRKNSAKHEKFTHNNAVVL